MERPIVLLALAGDAQTAADALQRAGFEPVISDGIPPDGVELAVLDCDLGADAVAAIYASLHEARAVPTLLLIGDAGPGPGLGGGADEVALKPLDPEALIYRLQALLIRNGRQLPGESGSWAASDSLSGAPVAGEGHVVSVFAPKGGVGKTTVAVNVAVALRLQTRASVLLFDADVGVGNVTSVLDVPIRMGLADLADSPQEEWTDAAFEHAVSIHAESGVRVMTWGTDPAESERVTVDLLLSALKWARTHHSYVIVDNHPGYDDRTMAMLAVANEIVLVVTPELGAIRNSSQFLQLARGLGLAGMVRVVVNRADHGISLTDMAASLGLPVAATIVSNGPKSVAASNEGHPIITKFPRERISDDLHRVARLISQPDAPAEAGRARARRWLPRFGTPASSA